MTFHANCGHEVEDFDDLVDVRYGSEHCDAIDGFRPCVVETVFCRACAKEAESWPEFIATDEEADEWLGIEP